MEGRSKGEDNHQYHQHHNHQQNHHYHQHNHHYNPQHNGHYQESYFDPFIHGNFSDPLLDSSVLDPETTDFHFHSGFLDDAMHHSSSSPHDSSSQTSSPSSPETSSDSTAPRSNSPQSLRLIDGDSTSASGRISSSSPHNHFEGAFAPGFSQQTSLQNQTYFVEPSYTFAKDVSGPPQPATSLPKAPPPHPSSSIKNFQFVKMDFSSGNSKVKPSSSQRQKASKNAVEKAKKALLEKTSAFLQKEAVTPLEVTDSDETMSLEAQNGSQAQSSSDVPDSVSSSEKTASGKRRSSHKIVERRYRNNLNDRISGLCDVVPTLANSEQKEHKPTILKKTQEYITHIQAVNARLFEENKKLKGLVNTLGGTVMLEKLGILPETEHTQPAPSSSKSLGDGMRILIIFFMGFCLFTNPISLPKGDSSVGRQLHTLPQDSILIFGLTVPEISSFISSLLVQIIFICACLFMVFVGDPVASMTEHQIRIVSERKAQAEASLKKGNLEEASQMLKQVLSLLGRPRHLTTSELIFSLIWQVSRQVSHLCLLGGWVDRILATRTPHSINSFSVAAVANHQYHKIQLARGSPNHLMNALVCLSSLNLAEAVGMDPFFMARINAAVAFQLKLILPKSLDFIVWHYVSQASKNLARSGHSKSAKERSLDWLSESASSISWLSHPEGSRFLRNHELNLERPQLTALYQTDDPFAKIGVAFTDYLLKKSYIHLIQKARGSQTLTDFQEIEDISTSGGHIYGRWWALIGCALSFWSLGQFAKGQACLRKAEELYAGGKGGPSSAQKATSQVILSMACHSFSHLLDGDVTQSLEAAKQCSLMIRNELEINPPSILLSRNLDLCCLKSLGLCVASSLLMDSLLLLQLKYPKSVSETSWMIPTEFKNFRKLVVSPRSSPFHGFLRTYLYIYHAVSNAQSEGAALRTQLLFSKGLQSAKEMGDRYAEGLAHFYRGCLDLQLDRKEQKRCLQSALKVFKEVGSFGVATSVEDHLKSASTLF